MFDTPTIFLLGGFLLFVGVSFAGIVACLPKSRVVPRPMGIEKPTPGNMVANNVNRLHAVFEARREDRDHEDSERELRLALYRERYAAVATMAPRAAIVKIWRDLELNVLRRAADEVNTSAVPTGMECSDAWILLSFFEVIDETVVSLLVGMERVRNTVSGMVQSSVEPRTAAAFLDMAAGLVDVMGGLERPAPAVLEAHRRHSERGVVLEAFSVMPLARNQRVVMGSRQGSVILTPEVLKQQERARRASLKAGHSGGMDA